MTFTKKYATALSATTPYCKDKSVVGGKCGVHCKRHKDKEVYTDAVKITNTKLVPN